MSQGLLFLFENILPDYKSILLTAQITPPLGSFALIKHQGTIGADISITLQCTRRSYKQDDMRKKRGRRGNGSQNKDHTVILVVTSEFLSIPVVQTPTTPTPSTFNDLPKSAPGHFTKISYLAYGNLFIVVTATI